MEEKIFLWSSKIQKKHYPIVAFLLVFFLGSLAFLYSGLIPIGNKSILTVDLYGQYYDFVKAFRRMVLSGESIFYSWNLGMGQNIIGWVAYYVTSPFHLLLLMVPESMLLQGVTCIILLKISAAAYTFGLFLRKVQKQEGIEVILFSCYYALCGYAATYYFNIMWLDALVLLPIVLIQVNHLIRTKKMVPLMVALGILFVSNYYMAYMVGIFTFFCFCGFYIMKKEHFDWREFLGTFLRFLFSAVVAACMCGALLLPTFFQMMSLQEGHATQVNWLSWNVDVLGWYHNLFVGSYTTLEEGKPLIYTGVLAVILLPLYFGNHKIVKKEKWVMVSLLGILFFLMSFPWGDMLMHGGVEPTWFLYRYSFFLSFLLAIIGAREFPFLLQERPKKLFIIMGVNGGLLLLFPFTQLDVTKVIGNLILLVVMGGSVFLTMVHKIKARDFYVLLLCFMAIELVGNFYLSVKGIQKEVGYPDTKEILEEQQLTHKALLQLEKQQDDFYRVEKNYKATYNDSISAGYSGIGSFSSVYSPGIPSFLWNMGYWVRYWRVQYSGSTEFMDSILGVKYIFHNEKKQLFQVSSGHSKEQFYIEENKYALPLGFMVDQQVKELSFGQEVIKSPFENQQKLLEAMLGEDDIKLFQPYQPIERKLQNVSREVVGGKIRYRKIKKDQEAIITYTIDRSVKEGSYYFYFPYDNSGKKTQKVILTTPQAQSFRSRYVEYKTGEVPFLFHVDQDTFTIDLEYVDEFVIDKEEFYYLDYHQLQRAYDKLKENPMEIVEHRDTYVLGQVTVKEDGVLYTSIPYEKGWTVLVDGKKQEGIPLFDGGFIGVSLEKGNHTIEFSFVPPGWRVGLVISTIGILIFVNTIIFGVKKYKKY